MRLSDLNDEQKVLLAAWFVLADAYPPSSHEQLPLEAREALSELSASTGKYPRAPFRDYHAMPHLVHGKRRQVRRRKGRSYELAS